MVDIEYFKRRQKLIELRYNPYHDPSNGRFTSGGGGGGGMLVVPKGQKGKGFYVAPDTLDKGEKALSNGEYEKWQKDRQNVQGQTAEETERIKNEIVESVNPNLLGIKKKALNGEGNWSWTKETPRSEKEAQEWGYIHSISQKGDYTVVVGRTGKNDFDGIGYFAAKSTSPTIAKLKKMKTEQAAKEAEKYEIDRKQGFESLGKGLASTTSTYDRWYKGQQRKFNNYWNANAAATNATKVEL